MPPIGKCGCGWRPLKGPPANIGRVSAFGWSMGYFGGIVLLLICYVGFIAPEVGWFGSLEVQYTTWKPALEPFQHSLAL